MGQMQIIKNLDQFMDGALTERFKLELDRVMENVHDPNTDATAKRGITISIEITPNEDRNTAQFKAKVTSKLASTTPVVKSVFVDLEDDGSVIATEMTNQVPGQIDMEGKTNMPKVMKFGEK